MNPPEEALEMLNTRPEFNDSATKYSVMLKVNGAIVNTRTTMRDTWTGNILMTAISITYMDTNKPEMQKNVLPKKIWPTEIPVNSIGLREDDNEEDILNNFERVVFTNKNLTHIDSDIGSFTFVKDNFTLTLTKMFTEQFNYRDLAF